MRPYAHLPHHVVEGLYPQTSPNGRQRLSVNVWETDEAYLATFIAPGLDEQTINVTVHEDRWPSRARSPSSRRRAPRLSGRSFIQVQDLPGSVAPCD
jgi:HSP20 family molecular chaperone IbpA